ncbi:MAG: aminotransferase, partial [Rubrivivax sp.]|nr:aminotransferase [Pyrinomonadaceae bacterium]
ILLGWAYFNVFVPIRGAAIRAPPHLYNDAGDIEKLFAVLKELI